MQIDDAHDQTNWPQTDVHGFDTPYAANAGLERTVKAPVDEVNGR